MPDFRKIHQVYNNMIDALKNIFSDFKQTIKINGNFPNEFVENFDILCDTLKNGRMQSHNDVYEQLRKRIKNLEQDDYSERRRKLDYDHLYFKNLY